ncbi:MAG: hypothetical protein K8R74_02125 [Bacteroidales bacterium]|nr:hypothetical protein [Bacteroidales bacterium]
MQDEKPVPTREALSGNPGAITKECKPAPKGGGFSFYSESNFFDKADKMKSLRSRSDLACILTEELNRIMK